MADQSALNAILQPGGITPLFQPIVRLASNNGGPRIVAVECLSRGPKGTNFESAPILFDYVRYKREESAVDRACIAAALEQAAALPPDLILCVNVHASTLGRDASFVPFLRSAADRNHIAMSRLTVEVVEHAPPWDSAGFTSAIAALRAAGAKVAVDDVGLGQSNFKMLIDVSPDYLKLDRYFVDRCVDDPKRQAVISAVARLSAEFGAEVVAEGVEEEPVIEVLHRYGIGLMQGYFFAEPLPADEVNALISSARSRAPSWRSNAGDSDTADRA
jgi:EAL domain-containing protein (putative c-di-GMP-specific phosphodiesterase class I)